MSLETLLDYAELDNIAEELSQDQLNTIGTFVCENYKIDKESRTDWEQRSEEAMRLAAQVVERKSTPWPGAANIKFPLLTEAAMQFNARAYPALIPSTDLVKARIVGEDHSGEKLNSAIRVSRHMSYQLLEEMEEWEEEFDAMLMALPILGCMFKKTYYCPVEGRNKSEIIYPKDLVVEYYTKNLKEAYRITHVLSMTKNDIKIKALHGVFSDVVLSDELPEADRLKQEILGLTAPKINSATPRDILEQHTYYDLDEDGLAEPYIITVDLKSEKVLRMVACYEPEEIIADYDGTVLRVPKMEYFTKYGFIPNPDGSFYDLGFGHLLGPINHTVDTSINQLLDAGTLNNLQSGFISRGIRAKMGELRFKPGEWKTINSTADDLRKNIVPLPTSQPSNVMFQLLGMMVNAGQRLASTIDSMVGENPGQNQKATTTMAVLEQGSKVFNAIHKRMYRALKQEFKKLFKLNSKYLDVETYFNIIDPKIDINVFAQIGREDYNEKNINIIPAADSSAPTQQLKLAKAQGLMELLPTGLINEQEALFRILEAMEQPGLEALIKQPQPPQPDLELQFKMQQEQNRAREAMANFQLEVIKTQQADVQVQAQAILALAKAEAEEVGPQLELYKSQLDTIKELSKNLGQQAKQLSSDVETTVEDYSYLWGGQGGEAENQPS